MFPSVSPIHKNQVHPSKLAKFLTTKDNQERSVLIHGELYIEISSFDIHIDGELTTYSLLEHTYNDEATILINGEFDLNLSVKHYARLTFARYIQAYFDQEMKALYAINYKLSNDRVGTRHVASVPNL